MNKIKKILLSTVLMSGLLVAPVLNAEETNVISDYSFTKGENGSLAVTFKANEEITLTGFSLKLNDTTVAIGDIKVLGIDEACDENAATPISDTSKLTVNNYCYYIASTDANVVTLTITGPKNTDNDPTVGVEIKKDMTSGDVQVYDYAKQTELLTKLLTDFEGYIKLSKNEEGNFDVYLDLTKTTDSIYLANGTTAYYLGEVNPYDNTMSQRNINEVYNEIANLANNTVFEINPDSSVVDNTLLEYSKFIGNPIYFLNETDRLYGWAFNQDGKLEETDFNVDLSVVLENIPSKEKIEKLLTNSSDAFMIKFNHNGELPKGTSFGLYVGDKFKKDDVLVLYYYNEAENKLEKQIEKIIVDEDGNIEFNISHCSEYVLYKVGNNAQTSSLNVALYVSIALISLAGMAYICIRKN